jgi:VanZ family protein
VTPTDEHPTLGLGACIPHDWNDLLFNVLHTGGGIFGNVLNLLLLLPLTASLVLAAGRILPAVALAVLVPPMVELAQTQLPGRSCVVSDLLTNVTGAILGVAIGWAVERRLQRTRS